MIKLRGRSMKAAAIVALSFLFAGVGVTAASATQPDFICEAYDSGKIDTTGDPATVEVTAPEGKLISGYCVKAGTEKFFVEVDPPQKTVIVDHPTKDSVSHYSLRYVDEVVELTETTPTAPTVDPICGANNDAVTVPTTEGITYSDTGWVEGERTIMATADEGYVLTEGQSSWTFTDDATACPIEITGVSVTVADPPICGPNNDTVNIPEVEGLTFDDTGWVDNERTVTAIADEGYVLNDEAKSSWTFYDEATACPVTTVAPTVVAICLPDNDTVTIPEFDGVVYTDSSWVDGERTITAAAAEGYALTEGSVTSWTFTDVPAATCPDEPPAFSYTPTGELAYTGVSTGTNGLTALAIFLMASGTALVGLRVRAAR